MTFRINVDSHQKKQIFIVTNPREVQNPLWHRDDVTSYLKYYQLTSEILDYKLILFGSGHFDHNMEKNITVIGIF